MPADDIWTRLAAPFPPHKVKTLRKGGKDLSFITARLVQERLDEVFGPVNWRCSFREWREHDTLCRLEVRIPGTQEWIAKEDGADEADISSTKSGFSGSLKRAAVHFGIGRYLYPETPFEDDEPAPRQRAPAARKPDPAPKPAPAPKREQARAHARQEPGPPPFWGEKITKEPQGAGNFYVGMAWGDAWDMDKGQFYTWVKEVCEEIAEHWRASGKKYELTEEDKRFGVAASYLEPLMRSKPK